MVSAFTALLSVSFACESDPSSDTGGELTETGGSNGLNVGSASGSGGTGNGVDAPSCAELTGSARPVPSSLLFVIDRSGSMNCNEPKTGDPCSIPRKQDPSLPSKWELTKDALKDSFGQLGRATGLGGISAGLLTFPNDDFCGVAPEGELDVPFASLDDPHLAALSSELDVAVPDGQTPLVGAGARGLEALRRLVNGGVEGRVLMVLMTDGNETCQVAELPELVEYVRTARMALDVKTFVIGAPGSEQSRAMLSELAFVGGTARSANCSHGAQESSTGDCHFDMTMTTDFAADLSAALESITDTSALYCEFEVPEGAMVDSGKINVEFTPGDGPTETIPKDADRACAVDAQGWQFSDGGSKVVLCGDVCERVKRDFLGKVDVVFGCKDTLVR